MLGPREKGHWLENNIELYDELGQNWDKVPTWTQQTHVMVRINASIYSPYKFSHMHLTQHTKFQTASYTGGYFTPSLKKSFSTSCVEDKRNGNYKVCLCSASSSHWHFHGQRCCSVSLGQCEFLLSGSICSPTLLVLSSLNSNLFFWSVFSRVIMDLEVWRALVSNHTIFLFSDIRENSEICSNWLESSNLYLNIHDLMSFAYCGRMPIAMLKKM